MSSFEPPFFWGGCCTLLWVLHKKTEQQTPPAFQASLICSITVFSCQREGVLDLRSLKKLCHLMMANRGGSQWSFGLCNYPLCILPVLSWGSCVPNTWTVGEPSLHWGLVTGHLQLLVLYKSYSYQVHQFFYFWFDTKLFFSQIKIFIIILFNYNSICE